MTPDNRTAGGLDRPLLRRGAARKAGLLIMGRDSYHCQLERLGGARRLGTIDRTYLFDGTEVRVTIALLGPAALQRPAKARSERLARASGMPELARQMIQRRHERCGQHASDVPGRVLKAVMRASATAGLRSAASDSTTAMRNPGITE
jgi:hypothetical protein